MVATDRIDTTRASLLDAAIRLFGQHGYDGVTTRMLAEHAGVNLAAIKYHFGSKDDLYVGAIDSIVALIEPRLIMVTGVAGQAKAIAGDDPERQAHVISQLVDAVLTTFLATPLMQAAIPFVLRELFIPGPHFERLYSALPRRLHEVLTDLVAWILGIDPASDQAKIRAHAMAGQMLIYHLGRPVLLRRLEIASYDAATIEEIHRQAKISILASLGLPHEN